VVDHVLAEIGRHQADSRSKTRPWLPCEDTRSTGSLEHRVPGALYDALCQVRSIWLEKGRPETTIVELGDGPRKRHCIHKRVASGNLVALDLVDDLLSNTTPKRQPHPDVGWEVNASPDA
jgi:hypothetical protein